MNTSVGGRLPAIIFSQNFQMLNIMKIPWIEKCPWLASVATRYFLNVLTRQTEWKRNSFYENITWKAQGQADWSVSGSNSSKGPCDFLEGGGFMPSPA